MASFCGWQYRCVIVMDECPAILAATPGLCSEPEPVAAAFAARLTTAVDCLRRQQDAQFLN